MTALTGNAGFIIAECERRFEALYNKSRETGHHGTRDRLLEQALEWECVGEWVKHRRAGEPRTKRVRIGSATWTVTVL